MADSRVLAADSALVIFVEDGDEIVVDLYLGTINMNVSEDMLDERRKNLKPYEHKGLTRYLKRYSESVSSSNEGAVLK